MHEGLIIEKKLMEELRKNEERAKADLQAMTRLQKVGMLSFQDRNLESILTEIVQAAIEISGADFGNIQLLDHDTGHLRIAAHPGFPKWWLDFWANVSSGKGSCGTALARGERVIIEDVEQSEVFAGTPALEIQRKAGIRAVQSTPLINRSGNMIGVLSTHYKRPHRPDERELRIVDLFARQAADIIEETKADESLRESERKYRALIDATSQVLYRMNADWSELTRVKGGGFVADTEEPDRNWIQKYIYADDQKLVMDRIQLAVRTGTPFELEYRVHRADGTIGWTLSRAIPVRNAAGEVLEWFGAASDITDRKMAEEMLRTNEERFREAFANAPMGIIIADVNAHYQYANKAYLEMTGYSEKELLRTGWMFFAIVHPDDRRNLISEMTRLLAKKENSFFTEVRYRTKDRRTIWVRISASLMSDIQSRRVHVIALVEDITERKRLESALKESKALSDELNRISLLVHSTLDTKSAVTNALEGAEKALRVDAAAVGVFENGKRKNFTIRYFTNIPEKFKERCCSPVEAKGMHYVAVHRDAFAFNNLLTDDRVNTESWSSFNFRSLLAAPLMIRTEVIGAIMFFKETPSAFNDLHIDFARKMAVSLSVAFENSRLFEERGKMEKKMRHMAYHDPLTGLPNRRLFMEIMDLEQREADRNRKKMAVLFLDLDRFKEVNDTLGHDFGNLLLKQVSSRLKSQLRKTDTIARIGGDEFNIILRDIVRPEDTSEIADNIIAAFKQPFLIDGHELNITTSVGISFYPDDSEDLDTLLKYADIAMYHAKEQGRNQFQFYNSSINVKSLERMDLERVLRQSVERGEMEVYYQPLLDLRTQQIVSAEALARWRHSEKGLLEPKDFIPVAEETGFINELGEWSLKAVCTQIKDWLSKGQRAVRVTVNLSSRQFKDAGLVNKIAAILKETGVPPSLLGIEVTESIAMSDVERSAARMRELQKMGIEVSIDDFGTGYSSLNYLKRLPIERLKIDKTFVQDIARDEDDRAVVRAVTAMAHTMRLKVVAEGIETKQQLRLVEKAGCDELQGFLISKPVSAEEFQELVKAA